ncbi:solute carrier organic anion transporter family member 74D-like isoform X2 [Penaeus japonicus]|nr:solute carrier organic anion transporter family member 74D-like isoform X2 [Penaeus japonicus]XP_042863329.1 solute carrier organic anion transporter family member 74D-like isoform X2 [Penaeus japonicus]
MTQKKKFINGGLKPRIVPTTENSAASRAKEDEVLALLTEGEPVDTICGLGSCKPTWLQFLARKECYLLVYCGIALMQGMFFTYTVSVISTIEKRFKLTSKESGAFLSGNDISQVILAIFLGYYGNFGHRPRWMGVGVMFAAASCFMALLPHLLYGPGQEAIDLAEASSSAASTLMANVSDVVGQKNKNDLCFSPYETTCTDEETGRPSYLGAVAIFFISQFFVGVAISVFFTIGVTYLDDNISKKTYPIYYAATLLLRILGPVLGYLMGGNFLSMWIDPTKSPNLTRRDPRWLGAWWLGFLVLGCVLALLGNLLFFFPRKLPATLRREARTILKQAQKDADEGENRGVEFFVKKAKAKKVERKPTLANLKKALKRIFTNKVWIANLFNTTTYILAVSGYWSFKPKYLENQFRKSAAEANYYTGVTSLASVILGTGLGGAVMRWARPSPRFVTGYNIFVTLFVCAGFTSLMYIGCPKLEIVGPVDGSPLPGCSSDCGCSDRFSPMCSEDQTTLFYSPCYAGCTVVNTSASPIIYSNCSCIMNTNLLTASSGNKSAVSFGGGVSGYCPEPCDSFFYYLIIKIIISTVTATGRVGSSVINLRCVEDEDKGLALGTLTVFISLFGLIPSPIMLGAVIDSACLVWDTSCGMTGNCWLYDSDAFRTILHLVPAVIVLISVLGDIVVFHYSRQLDLYGEREEEVNLEDLKEQTEESKPLNTAKGDGGLEMGLQ